MSISAFSGISSLQPLSQALVEKQSSIVEENPFRTLFEDAVTNVKQADAVVQEEAYKLVTGQSDDLHNITIASSKLSMATDLLIQIRNKTLDAYNELMRMGV